MEIKESLKNCVMWISPEDNENAQKMAFSLGYSWIVDNRIHVYSYHGMWLFFNEDYRLTFDDIARMNASNGYLKMENRSYKIVDYKVFSRKLKLKSISEIE
jgi:hypothetical protein